MELKIFGFRGFYKKNFLSNFSKNKIKIGLLFIIKFMKINLNLKKCFILILILILSLTIFLNN
jgi:hypothetical protein